MGNWYKAGRNKGGGKRNVVHRDRKGDEEGQSAAVGGSRGLP